MRAQPWHAAPCRSLSCACSEGAPTTRPRRPEPYDRGRVRYLARFDPETVRALVRAGESFWLDLDAPEPAILMAVDAELGLDPGAWAAAGFNERGSALRGPFLWSRGDLLVLSAILPAEPERSLPKREILIRVGQNWVVSTHPGVEALRALRDTGHPRLPGVVVGRILASAADSFSPLLLELDLGIDDAQQLALDADGAAPGLIQTLRGRALELRHLALAHRQVAGGLLDEFIDSNREADESRAARGAYERFARLVDALDVDRELLSAATDVHLAATSNRLSHLAERLGIFATIFLPLALVVGFFGQNFRWLTDRTESLTAFLVLGVGSIVFSVLLVLAFLAWRGYLRSPQ